jgi:hypothetical protein
LRGFLGLAGRTFLPNPRFPVPNETFSRDLRYAAMQPDIWYVAFGPNKTLKTDDSANAAVRSTRTFKSEVDAKLFAMQILAKGWSASAGTLNPHQPKQVVAASQIERWAAPGLGG